MASTNLSLDDLKNKVNKLENKQVNEMARIKELENKQDLLDNKQAVLEKKVDDAFPIKIYNPDGIEVGACGNGSRCVAYLISKEKILTDIGIILTSKTIKFSSKVILK